jgi:glyceraldehyde-3-phosphate dehydrogenase (NADP+)
LTDRSPPVSPTPIHQRQWLVGGKLRHWDGPVRDVVSPVLTAGAPTPLGSFQLLGQPEALEALAAAAAAWGKGRGVWPTMTVAARIGCVERFLSLMIAVRERVVETLVWEIGKSRPDSEKEFDRTVAYVRDTLAAVKELDRAGSRFQQVEGIVAQVRRAPLGVTLCMGPFNYPLNETFTTLIPALVMGNPVIVKPAKYGVLLLEPLLAPFAEAFPAGVVNTIYGQGKTVVSPLVASGGIDVLAFIGTSKAADTIRRDHPKPHRMRCVLGLEAKNVAIVTPSADLDAAVRECLAGSLAFNGQRCTAIKLVAVARPLFASFVEAFAAAVDRLVVGSPWTEGVGVTPLPEPDAPERMAALVADAEAKGARVLNGRAGRVDATTFFPAVVGPVTKGMRLWHEEQFGPVVPIAVYDDIEEPLDWVRDADHGQQASIFSRDSEEVAVLIDGLANQVCRVNLNSQCQRGPDVFPFTGRKDSAEGTLSVSDALRAFSIRSMAAAKDTPGNRAILGDIVLSHRSSFLSTDWLF